MPSYNSSMPRKDTRTAPATERDVESERHRQHPPGESRATGGDTIYLGIILHYSITENLLHTPTKLNFKPLASFNCFNQSTPAIAVPGHPAVYHPKPQGVTTILQPDNNGHGSTSDPVCRLNQTMTPTLLALRITLPDFTFPTGTILTDRSSLRKLLDFIVDPEGLEASENENKFTLRLQRVGPVHILCAQQSEESVGNWVQYGHSFERAYTKWPVGMLGKSAAHYRVVSYQFCGLDIIMRFEVDAAILPRRDRSGWHSSAGFTAFRPSADMSGVTVNHVGRTIQHSAIAEMKTRSEYVCPWRRFDKTNAQLWFSHTTHLLVGVHKNGVISSPVTEVDVVANRGLAEWEEYNKSNLRRMGWLLRELCILATLSSVGGRALYVRWKGQAHLEIFMDAEVEWDIPEELREWIKPTVEQPTEEQPREEQPKP